MSVYMVTVAIWGAPCWMPCATRETGVPFGVLHLITKNLKANLEGSLRILLLELGRERKRWGRRVVMLVASQEEIEKRERMQ